MSKRPTKRQLQQVVAAKSKNAIRVPAVVATYGACAESSDPDLFFRTDAASVRAAKEICRGCPARIACLGYAVKHEDEGVWGGKTPAERLVLAGGEQPMTPEEFAEYWEWINDIRSGKTVAAMARDRECAERTIYRFKADLRAFGLLADLEREAGRDAA